MSLCNHPPVCYRKLKMRRLWVHLHSTSWSAPRGPPWYALCRYCLPQILNLQQKKRWCSKKKNWHIHQTWYLKKTVKKTRKFYRKTKSVTQLTNICERHSKHSCLRCLIGIKNVFSKNKSSIVCKYFFY